VHGVFEWLAAGALTDQLPQSLHLHIHRSTAERSRTLGSYHYAWSDTVDICFGLSVKTAQWSADTQPELTSAGHSHGEDACTVVHSQTLLPAGMVQY